ncbi:MAG TPA: queuosine precursor transporter [Cyclobacteriaceae bacterium]|nr:queuosine precursor transporter [Cyclobacteriaceae bacterium]
MNSPLIKDKKTNLFIILSGIFLTNAIIAEMIGVKIFSLESTLGLAPAGLKFFFSEPLDLNLTAGVIIWPVVFITTDIINEYFGKKGVKKISFLTAGFIMYIFFIIYFVTSLPPAPLWLKVNEIAPDGSHYNINFAFTNIFRQGMGIIIGSITAFLIGQLLDVFIFQRLKFLTGPKKIWFRATGSTMVSQFVDSFLVLIIAFYLFGNLSLAQVIAIGIINYVYKVLMAIVLIPLLYAGHFLIDRYLGKEESERMSEEASRDRSFF